jgi:hypothetical protein
MAKENTYHNHQKHHSKTEPSSEVANLIIRVTVKHTSFITPKKFLKKPNIKCINNQEKIY